MAGAVRARHQAGTLVRVPTFRQEVEGYNEVSQRTTWWDFSKNATSSLQFLYLNFWQIFAHLRHYKLFILHIARTVRGRLSLFTFLACQEAGIRPEFTLRFWTYMLLTKSMCLWYYHKTEIDVWKNFFRLQFYTYINRLVIQLKRQPRVLLVVLVSRFHNHQVGQFCKNIQTNSSIQQLLQTSIIKKIIIHGLFLLISQSCTLSGFGAAYP